MADEKTERRLFLSSLSVGIPDFSLEPIKIRAGLNALERGIAPASVEEYLDKFALSAETPRQRVLSSGNEYEVEVGRQVYAAVLKRQLLPHEHGFLPNFSNATPPLLMESAIALRRFFDKGTEAADLGYKIAGVAGRWAGKTEDEVFSDLMGRIERLGAAPPLPLSQLWNKGVAEKSDLLDLADKVLTGALNLGKTSGDLAHAVANSPIRRDDPELFSVLHLGKKKTGEAFVPEMRAATSFLYTALTLLDVNAAKTVGSAITYAQGAIQIKQSLVLLASAPTGLGVITALSGLMGGLGGMGAFGDISGSGKNDIAADHRHKALMEAMQTLFETMRAEFSRLNSKVDLLIGQSVQISMQLRDVQIDVKEILRSVKQIEDKVDLGLLQLALAEARIKSDIMDAADVRLRSQIDSGIPLSKGDLVTALQLHADMAVESCIEVAYDDAIRDSRRKLIAEVFNDPFSGQEDTQAYGSALAALMGELVGYGLKVPVAIANPLLLQRAMRYFAEIRRSNGQVFDELQTNPQSRDIRDEQIRQIRIAEIAHDATVRTLIGPLAVSGLNVNQLVKAVNTLDEPMEVPAWLPVLRHLRRLIDGFHRATRDQLAIIEVHIGKLREGGKMVGPGISTTQDVVVLRHKDRPASIELWGKESLKEATALHGLTTHIESSEFPNAKNENETLKVNLEVDKAIETVKKQVEKTGMGDVTTILSMTVEIEAHSVGPFGEPRRGRGDVCPRPNRTSSA